MYFQVAHPYEKLSFDLTMNTENGLFNSNSVVFLL